jgi:hypothetical protein
MKCTGRRGGMKCTGRGKADRAGGVTKQCCTGCVREIDAGAVSPHVTVAGKFKGNMGIV